MCVIVQINFLDIHIYILYTYILLAFLLIVSFFFDLQDVRQIIFIRFP